MEPKTPIKMIVKSRYGPVASWTFRTRSEQVNVLDRASLNERASHCQEIAAVLQQYQLLYPSNAILCGWVGQDPSQPPEPPVSISIAAASEIGDRCREALDELERNRGFRNFTNLVVTGTGTILDELERPREVSDLLWLDAYTIQFHCIQVITQSDIWLPFTLRGGPQAELAALNAPRLERALRAMASHSELSFSFEEITQFALNDGFHLANRKNEEGDPLDVIDDAEMLQN